MNHHVQGASSLTEQRLAPLGIFGFGDHLHIAIECEQRIAQVMADGLQVLGVDAEPTPDGMVIRQSSIGGGHVDSHGDHRIAMAFTIAALRASGEIAIDDCANVNTSFPGFTDLVNSIGMKVSLSESA